MKQFYFILRDRAGKEYQKTVYAQDLEFACLLIEKTYPNHNIVVIQEITK